eukprot:gnl/Spiro4/16818_TR9051_c0_g1_i1.p1 gnl/Spiro4/16818_TR9051_c0_g1~~gnl/Spiro4/16818_TR9051_c0_g1_i1.p1  ORF type:complete len:387 (+),score=100.91 gnl/Spiro4/16818_TR9051_c0_g1_i1:58-1218(+)
MKFALLLASLVGALVCVVCADPRATVADLTALAKISYYTRSLTNDQIANLPASPESCGNGEFGNKYHYLDTTHNLMYLFVDDELLGSVLAVRGTQKLSMANWESDFSSNYNDQGFHSGFYELAQQMRADTALMDCLSHASAHGSALTFTGHSLGGSVVLILSYLLTLDAAIPVSRVITFGQPKVFSSQPTYTYPSELLRQPLLRVMNHLDIVPHFPAGYYHQGTELHMGDTPSSTTLQRLSDQTRAATDDFYNDFPFHMSVTEHPISAYQSRLASLADYLESHYGEYGFPLGEASFDGEAELSAQALRAQSTRALVFVVASAALALTVFVGAVVVLVLRLRASPSSPAAATTPSAGDGIVLSSFTSSSSSDGEAHDYYSSIPETLL